MTFEDFKADILLSLSSQLVDVEFECPELQDDSSIDFCFRRARDVYQQKGNNNWDKTFLSLPVETGKTVYDLPTTPDPTVNTIIKIIRPTSSAFTGSDALSLSVGQQLLGGNLYSGQCCGTSKGMDYLMYELTLNLIERSNTYTAYEMQWNHNKFNNTVTLLKQPATNETWFIECYKNLTDDQYRDVLWIKEYAEAEAKKILGQAYRKFQSLPSPTGETNLGGDQLVQEANEEQRRLIEEINEYTDGDVTYSEITFG